uniref:26S proteasome regulatory subunit RPN2 C-terminal domain-containing protein n=1 Tax=Corethron hystrix TaxID=216773 RepID=A0A7S1FUU4_9STRA
MYGLGLAYCGTGSEVAVRQLLHAAVSDVNDDVRMAAVISLALVLYRTPRRVPQLVKLLLESFHPHVRYASCIAVGIALAATGDAEALNMLEPMLTDMSDFVRQGGIIATALVLMQQSEANKKTKWFREKLVSIISDKHQSTLTKMGAVMATGILDAGGRNMSISLGSSTTGFTRMTTAVGLVLWLQQWHWYPMMHMFSLALTPTVTIGLNKDFNVPKCFGITCNAKPSLYAYPKKLEEKKEEKKKRIETVALSTTAKSKAREARKKSQRWGILHGNRRRAHSLPGGPGTGRRGRRDCGGRRGRGGGQEVPPQRPGARLPPSRQSLSDHGSPVGRLCLRPESAVSSGEAGGTAPGDCDADGYHAGGGGGRGYHGAAQSGRRGGAGGGGAGALRVGSSRGDNGRREYGLGLGGRRGRDQRRRGAFFGR